MCLHVRESGDAAAAEPHAALAASPGKGPGPWDPLAELAAARGEAARATLKWLMAALPEGCDMSYGQARARQQPCVRRCLHVPDNHRQARRQALLALALPPSAAAV